MNDNDERQQPEDRKPPKYVADEAGRSWLEVLNAARSRTERQREAHAAPRGMGPSRQRLSPRD
jgi:hypothetical protein